MCEVWEGCTRGPTCYIFLLVLGLPLPLVLVVLVLPLVLVVQSPTLLLRCGTRLPRRKRRPVRSRPSTARLVTSRFF